MRAAQIAELGTAPGAVDVEGGGAIEIVAVALNPLDLAVAAGRFYGGHPPLPYVPGCEAVGRLGGERVSLRRRTRHSAGRLSRRTNGPPTRAHGERA